MWTPILARGDSSRETAGESLRVVGLQSDAAAYLWIADPDATWYHAAQGQQPQERAGVTVRLENMAPGNYTVEWWNTRTGEVSRGEGVDHRGGTLTLTVPPFTADIACKLRG